MPSKTAGVLLKRALSNSLPDWQLLNGRARHLLDQVVGKWEALLRKEAAEEEYHSFVSEHAGLFFGGGFDSPVVISKLRVGAELTTDLVVAIDRRSLGITFNLIELEVPQSQAFTKRGHQSARLSMAIQQIQDWRRWLRENRSESRRLFPIVGTKFNEYDFHFTIVIGRRSDEGERLAKRNDLGKELRIDIRSFDYLTDLLKHRIFANGTFYCSTEESGLEESQRNDLFNPFHNAYTDSTWREIARQLQHNTHFGALNADLLLRFRTHNSLLRQFLRKYCKEQMSGPMLIGPARQTTQ